MSGNIIEIFLKVAMRHDNKPAIIQGDRVVTYQQMLTDVRRIAGYLRKRGLRPGSRALIFVPMSIDLYEILLGVFYLGGVAVFIDAWADRNRLAAACKMAAPDVFIGTTRAQLLRLVSSEIRAIPVKLRSNVSAWHGEGPPPEHAPADPDMPALVTFTTGSTGAPKGARRSHRFLVAQHRALMESLPADNDDIDMPVLPVFTLSNLAAGITTVVPPVDPRSVEEFKPGSVVRDIRRWSVTSSSGSPAFYNRLAGYCLEKNDPLPTLRRIFTGGAPVFPRQAERLLKAFPGTEITVVYGSTEAEPISTVPASELVWRAREDAHEGLLVGRPVDAIEVAIVPISEGPVELREGKSMDSLALPPGNAGEICVAGEHVLREYYGGEEIIRATKIRDGAKLWHRTGDAGYLNDDGELFLLGRARQSFQHQGRRIFPFPVEARLQDLPGVVIGTILRMDNSLVIVIEPEKGADAGAIKEDISGTGIPFDSIRMLDAIPRDPRHNSKIDYGELKKMIEQSNGENIRTR